MSKIGDKLARMANEDHQFEHGGQIKDFLIELGAEPQFKTGLADERVQFVTYGEHPTHFILVLLWSGYDHPKDNGYIAWCLAKKKWSFERFMEFTKRVTQPSEDRTKWAHFSRFAEARANK
jgi:hypothetical protein